MLTISGTAGLGEETISELSKHHPSHIYFTGRNSSNAEKVIASIKKTIPDAQVSFLKCDMASLASVQACAKSFLSQSSRLDILIANAGIMALPPSLTSDGYEIQFGTNHVGHALLIKLLLPSMLKTAEGSDVRLVIVTSTGFRMHAPQGIDFDSLKTTQDNGEGSEWTRYAQSKLANILYAAELGRRYPSITSVSIWPGVIITGLVTNLPEATQKFIAENSDAIPIEEGVLCQLWAGTGDKKDILNGGFYEYPKVVGEHTERSKDAKLAEQLWDWTQTELQPYNI
jgi:NAD(P)-dependent dehydrogenase (short-subunit alcohol dehydrogenase family)